MKPNIFCIEIDINHNKKNSVRAELVEASVWLGTSPSTRRSLAFTPELVEGSGRTEGGLSLNARRFPVPISALIACVFLAACNAYSPQNIPPGTPVNQVVERLGPATAQHQPPPEQSQAKSRLEFARGPMGKHTYMLDFDAQGRLLAWEQVLTEARFLKVEPGWRQVQVSAWLGTPSNVRSVGWRGETVWSYRYESPFCLWFEISLMQSVVVGTGHGPDPQCEDKGERRYD